MISIKIKQLKIIHFVKYSLEKSELITLNGEEKHLGLEKHLKKIARNTILICYYLLTIGVCFETVRQSGWVKFMEVFNRWLFFFFFVHDSNC